MSKKGKGQGGGDGGRVVARNKEARRRYDVEDTFEAGLVLTGTEIKSIRQGTVSLTDAYASMRGDEIWLHNLHIGPYAPAGPYAQHEPKRDRKLLLQRSQIQRIAGKLTQRGYSLVPLDVHLKGPWAKVQLGLAIGKKTGDRREDIKRKTAEREIQKHLRRR